MHLIDTAGPGGAETVFAQLVGSFNAMHGIGTIAVVPRRDWLVTRLSERNVEPVLLDPRGSFNLRYLASLVRLASKHGVGLIHTHLLGSAVYGAAVGILLRIPVIATLHGPTDFADLGRFVGLKRAILGAGISRYVAVSQSTKEAMTGFGIAEDRIVEIRNGIDTDAYVPGRSTALRAELGLSAGDFLVGAVGNIRKPKAYDVLLKAAALVLERMPNVHFAVIGGGGEELMPSLLELRRELELEPRFHFLGLRKADTALYQSLDVFVSSSRSEGLPISFLEAMASSLPIVATRSGGAEQVLDEGRFGVVVPANEPAALAAAIVQVLGDPKLRGQLAAAARARVVTDYSLRRTIDHYLAAYNTAASTLLSVSP